MATDANTIKHYDKNAEVYHKHVTNTDESIFHAFYEKPAIRSELPNLQGLEVISIGCGSGVDARWLADNGASRVVGVDISSGLLNIARRENPDIEFRIMNMEKLGFEDKCFDLAYSSLAIHYVDDWTPALKEALRILRPGGMYVFSCGHPIDSAVEYKSKDSFKYALLGRKLNLATDERTIYGDYLAREGQGVKPVKGILSCGDITVFHRTFSKMVEQIHASDFDIERVVEPQPTEAMKSVDPGTYDQLTRIPAIMIWVLRK